MPRYYVDRTRDDGRQKRCYGAQDDFMEIREHMNYDNVKNPVGW